MIENIINHNIIKKNLKCKYLNNYIIKLKIFFFNLNYKNEKNYAL